MDIQGGDEGMGVSMEEPVDVNEANNEARRAAIGVLVYSLQVLQYADAGRSHSLERVEAVPDVAVVAPGPGLLQRQLPHPIYEGVVASHQPLQHQRQYHEHSRGWLRRRMIALRQLTAAAA